MAQISFLNEKLHSRIGIDQAEEKELTMRDSMVKKLVNQQLNRNVNIDEAKNGKSFTSPISQEPFCLSFNGLMELKEFKNAKEIAEIKEILFSCKLSKEEISLLLNGFRSNISDYEKTMIIEEIELKLLKKQEELAQGENKFRGSIGVSRHEYEEEMSKFPKNDLITKISKCLLYIKPKINSLYGPNHPIHNLPDLHNKLFPKKKKRKRSKNMKDFYSFKKASLWDIKDDVSHKKTNVNRTENSNKCSVLDHAEENKSEKLLNNCPSEKSPFVFTRTIYSENKFDYSKPYVYTVSSNKLMPISCIAKNRIPMNVLMKQFPNYERGVLSKILYIKNLPLKCSPDMLASIFGNFEDKNGSKLIYRLFKGRMKGQAFITFKDEIIADEALNTCNGVKLEEKPMVIQFGHRHS